MKDDVIVSKENEKQGNKKKRVWHGRYLASDHTKLGRYMTIHQSIIRGIKGNKNLETTKTHSQTCTQNNLYTINAKQ